MPVQLVIVGNCWAEHRELSKPLPRPGAQMQGLPTTTEGIPRPSPVYWPLCVPAPRRELSGPCLANSVRYEPSKATEAIRLRCLMDVSQPAAQASTAGALDWLQASLGCRPCLAGGSSSSCRPGFAMANAWHLGQIGLACPRGMREPREGACVACSVAERRLFGATISPCRDRCIPPAPHRVRALVIGAGASISACEHRRNAPPR